MHVNFHSACMQPSLGGTGHEVGFFLEVEKYSKCLFTFIQLACSPVWGERGTGWGIFFFLKLRNILSACSLSFSLHAVQFGGNVARGEGFLKLKVNNSAKLRELGHCDNEDTGNKTQR